MRVLLVEDTASDRELIEMTLERSGLPTSITSCPSLKRARQALELPEYDVVLLDLSLPDAQGIEAVRVLASRCPDLPLIVLTETDDRSTAVRAIQSGAQEYLIKSELSPGVLAGLIRHAVARKHRENIEQTLHNTDRMVAMGQLAAGVAHEIANPLNVLLNTTEVGLRQLDELEQELLDLHARADRRGVALGSEALVERIQDVSRSLNAGLDGIERIRGLVGDLKALARQERRAVIEEVQIGDVLDLACSVTSAEIRHCGSFIKNYAAVPPVPADAGRLLQVFTNLLLNAIQALDPRRANENSVTVSTRLQDDAAVIEIRDTGSGMSDEVRSKALDSFFTTKPRGVGTGLGLPIARDLVQEHQGTLELDSAPGRGTAVTVRLPLQNGLTPNRQEAASMPQRQLDENTRLLLVDDDEIVSRALARLLAPATVTVANTVQEATELLDHGVAFDAIVCDLMMPVLDGVDFHAHVEALDPSLAGRIVFCSGGALTAKTREFVQEHAARVLPKPLRRAELVAAITAVLDEAVGKPAVSGA